MFFKLQEQIQMKFRTIIFFLQNSLHISLLMLTFICFRFTSIPPLFLKDTTHQTFSSFQSPKQQNPLQILNFGHHAKKNFLSVSIFANHKHTHLLSLYLKYLQNKEETPIDLPYQYIEQNLRKKAINLLKKNQMSIKIINAKIINTNLLQQSQILGLFIHRKYNLGYESYDVNAIRQDRIVCHFKKTMREDSLRNYEKALREFEKDKMETIYGKKFTEFLQQKSIIRYLYEMDIDLKLEIKQGNRTYIVGQQPTKHLLQIESLFSPFSNVEQFYLTDMDFFLQGNPFFRTQMMDQ